MLNLFKKNNNYKIIDSSALIDGRLNNIIDKGWLDGDIVVPQFVVDELQSLADSKDYSKRFKGRKGLDNIKKIDNVIIWNKKLSDVDEVGTVDMKLVMLTRHFNGKLLTLDSNLIKVSKIHNVGTLSIQELYIAVKPRFVIGDEFTLKIKEKGKEPGQGRGDYEGTMVVVDGAEDFIGRKARVEVRSVFSQDSGTLIFAKIIKGINETV